MPPWPRSRFRNLSPASGPARPQAPDHVRAERRSWSARRRSRARAQPMTLAAVPRQALRARRTRPVPGAAAGGHPGGLVPVAHRSPGRGAGHASRGGGVPGRASRSPSGRHQAIRPPSVPARRRGWPLPRRPAGPGNSGTPSAPSPRGSAARPAAAPAPARRSGRRVPRPPGSGRPGISRLAAPR